jgi:hypothetical protein
MFRNTFVLAFCGLGFIQPYVAQAETVVLPYQGTNQWVAQSDIAPLKKVLKAARKGVTEFNVVIPKSNTALAQQRLTVIQTLLMREMPNHAPLLAEISGTTAANTIKLSW